MAHPYPNITLLKVKQVRLDGGHLLSVYYIAPYWPTRYAVQHQQEDSVQILRLKSGNPDAAIYFSAKLNSALSGARQRYVVTMPSHTVGCAPISGGLRQLLRLVPSVHDLSDCLIRHTQVQQSVFAWPGRRPTAEAHRDSMRVNNPDQLRNRDLVLLDDVITMGASMCGASLVLEQAGANSVTCLSITSTQE